MTTTPILRLVLISFDSLENRSPEYEATVGLFIGDKDGLTALQRIEAAKADYLAKWPAFEGWNGQRYPQWYVVEDPIL